jgi:putative oxidoreductase
MKQFTHWLLTPPVTGSSNILIIRWMMATVCIGEGISEMVVGAAPAFAAIGEILGGFLLFLGLLTRPCCLYLMLQTTLLATFSTTPELHLSETPLLHLKENYTELLSCLYLLIQGPGRRSLDFRISTAGKIYRMN